MAADVAAAAGERDADAAGAAGKAGGSVKECQT